MVIPFIPTKRALPPGASTPTAARGWTLEIRTGRGLLRGRAMVLIGVSVLLPLLASMLGGYEARYALSVSVPLAIAILGGNIVSSTAGDVNLALGAEMAIGAYSAAYGEAHGLGLLLSVLMAIIVTAVATAIVSLGIVRLSGVYTALATFAFAFCIPDLTTYLASVTGGGVGEYVLPVKFAGLSLGGASMAEVYVAMGAFLILSVAWLAILSGRAGRVMLLLGDAEPALVAFGRSVYWLKMAVWVGGGIVAGIAGVLYGMAVGYLNPQEFTFYLSLYLFVGGVVGGTVSPMGALVGGLIVGMVPIYLGGKQGGVEDVLFGVLLMAALLIGRRGLWPRVEGAAARIRAKSGGTAGGSSV